MPTEFRHPITNFINPHRLPFAAAPERDDTYKRISEHIQLGEILLDPLNNLLSGADDFEARGGVAGDSKMHE